MEVNPDIVEEMAKGQTAMQKKVVIREVTLVPYGKPEDTMFKTRKWVKGSGGTEETGPIERVDAVPGQINIHYENGFIRGIVYNPEKFDMNIFFEPYVEPLIMIPEIHVNGFEGKSLKG